MSIRNLMWKKRYFGLEKEEAVMEAKNKSAEIKEELEDQEYKIH